MRVPTKISVLDELIEGGLPKPALLGILGESSSGKSVFCYQLAWNLLQQGFLVLYYTADERVDGVRDTMNRFGWDVTSYEEKGALKFIDVLSKGLETVEHRAAEGRIRPDRDTDISFDFRWMMSEGNSFYLRALGGDDLLVIYDSLSTLFSSVRDPQPILQFVHNLKYAVRVCHALGVVTLQLGVHAKEVENAYRFYADDLIEMRRTSRGGHVARYFRIANMRRTKFEEAYFLMDIADSGIILYKIPLKMPITFEEGTAELA